MPKAFSDEAIKYFGEVYQQSTARHKGLGGGCMMAAYEGAAALFGAEYGFRGQVYDEFRQLTDQDAHDNVKNEYDDWLHFLEGRGVTEKVGTFRPNTKGKWNLNNEVIITSIEDYLVNTALCLSGDSQYFGIAVCGGKHSIIVRVDKDTSQVYWMDQYSKGYGRLHDPAFVNNPDVTGKFDSELRVCSRIDISGQTSHHELDHGGLDEGKAGRGEALEIL